MNGRAATTAELERHARAFAAAERRLRHCGARPGTDPDQPSLYVCPKCRTVVTTTAKIAKGIGTR